MSRVLPEYFHRRRSQICTTLHVHGWRSLWQRKLCDWCKLVSASPWSVDENAVCGSLCHVIFNKEKLNMFIVFAAKFVPRQLTDGQKESLVTISQDLFDCSNVGENFIKKYPAHFFPSPKLKCVLKDYNFRPRKKSRKFSSAHWKKKLENTSGPVYQQWKELLLICK